MFDPAGQHCSGTSLSLCEPCLSLVSCERNLTTDDGQYDYGIGPMTDEEDKVSERGMVGNVFRQPLIARSHAFPSNLRA
jgi:hypothetical protein